MTKEKDWREGEEKRKRNEIKGTKKNEKTESQLLNFVVQEIMRLFPPLIRLEYPHLA